jgi:hypothetical protein
MADKVITATTTLSPEDVVIRAVQFFSGENWRPSSHSGRTATFQGKPPIPWLYLALTIVGLVFCIVPGVIMYIMVIKKLNRFHNLVVTANPAAGETQVTIQCPDAASKLANRFIAGLPGNQPVI